MPCKNRPLLPGVLPALSPRFPRQLGPIVSGHYWCGIALGPLRAMHVAVILADSLSPWAFRLVTILGSKS